MGLDIATGKHPGTTRRISKYPLNQGLVLVDLPGFGRVARGSKRLEEKIKGQILDFLASNAERLALAVHVLDISTFREVTRRLAKKGFISVDVEMVLFLAKTLGEFPLVAANKIDRTNGETLEANLTAFRDQIRLGQPEPTSGYIFPVSAKKGDGLGALKAAIHEKLVAKGYRTPLKIC